jgi:hypothetical protein
MCKGYATRMGQVYDLSARRWLDEPVEHDVGQSSAPPGTRAVVRFFVDDDGEAFSEVSYPPQVGHTWLVEQLRILAEAMCS